jgi:hydroxypyruvate isomerase
MPGYALTGIANGIQVIEAVGPDRLGLQFDLYHTQITEGDLVPRARAALPYIAHMQVADTPGRNEPGTGEVNWPFVFAQFDEMGYRGWIGCEYRPAGETLAGLSWFAPYKD